MRLYYFLIFFSFAVAHANTGDFDEIFPMNYYPGSSVGIDYSVNNNALSKIFPSFNKNGIDIHGWLNPSYNYSQNHQTNLPISFALVPNTFLFEQGVLVLEKLPNTIQKSKIDVGFSIYNLFGSDYRFTTMQGVFSQQYLQQNKLYGYDPIIANLQMFVPGIGEGTLLTIGRFLALGDIEVPLSHPSFLITHSIGFTNSAFTQMGLLSNTKLNDNWTMILGMHSSSDVAWWGASAHPSFVGFIQWTGDDKNNSVLAGTNSINNGQYSNGHDNLQQLNIIWSHRFSETFFTMSSFYYEYMFNGRQGGDCTFGPYEPYGGGRGCGPIIPGYSSSISAMTHWEKKLNENTFSSFRFEYFNDFQGQRTGYQTAYVSFVLGITEWIDRVFKIRPEFRYDLGLSGTPYDNQTRSSAVLGLIDVIALF